MRTTLVIMAAGMATRFGGGKQVTPVDEEGQLIIDYSLYDAKRAGFDRVVFVIRPEMQESFHEAIGARIAGHMEVRYAYQTMDRFFPADCAFPEGRTKPWAKICRPRHMSLLQVSSQTRTRPEPWVFYFSTIARL